jgi:hypothetical protein
MGAEQFYDHVTGTNAQEAFQKAKEQAFYEFGHRGYTGTIAEKESYVIVGIVNTEEEANVLANSLMDKDDPRIHSKWGPAGCIKIRKPKSFLFFGYASS